MSICETCKNKEQVELKVNKEPNEYIAWCSKGFWNKLDLRIKHFKAESIYPRILSCTKWNEKK